MALAQDAEAVTAEMSEAGGAEGGPGGRTGGAPPQSTSPEYGGSVITAGPRVGAMTTEPTKDVLHQPNGDTARTTADSAATKPTADGAATKPTADSAATKPTADSAFTKPTADSAVTKPTADSAATKPTTDGAATKPTADGAATKPTADGAATKPTADGAATKPTTDSAANKPTADGAATKPTADSAATKPTADSAFTKPTADGAATKTTTDGAATKPTADGAATKTTTDCAATKPTADGAATKTTTDCAATKTTADGAATKTTADGAATKPTADFAATMTPTSGSKSNPGKITVDTTKTTASETSGEPAKTALDKELEALLSLDPADPPPHDVLMIQSEPNGTVDILKADPTLEDPNITGKGPPPPLRPATTWTSANLREFKHRMASEKHGLLTIRRGEVVTVRVPTHPEGKRLCWEFATDDYDIGFGIYFDWTPVTSTAVTLQVSESSDDEEEETESPWHSREGDVERGSVYRLRSRYGEIMQVYRRDSHREVQAGSHDYPGEGVYLLKLDNSYSLLRNKTLYFHVYYSS